MNQLKRYMKARGSLLFQLASTLFLLSVGFLAYAGPAAAQDVVLTWDPNAEPDVAGYKLYFGTASRKYSTTVDAGNATSCTVKGLLAGTYYFAVTAYNRAGLESGFSSEVRGAVGPPFVTTLFCPRPVSSHGNDTDPAVRDNTGIAVVNLGNQDAALWLTALNSDGTQAAGTDVWNPVSLLLEKGRQMPLLDSQVFGLGLPKLQPVGWLKLESTVANLAGFFMSFNDDLSILDGADVSSTTLSSFVFPEIQEEGFTQIHVANPNNEAVTLTFDWMDAKGRITASSKRQIQPNGSIAEPVASLFPAVNGVPASDYIQVTSDHPVVPFEYLGKEGIFVLGLNGQDTGTGATVLYSPQYVLGGDYRSTLSVVNLDSIEGEIQFRFIGDDGTPIGAAVVRHIDARGKVYISEQDLFLPVHKALVQGYVEIRSNGPKLTGNVVFGDPERSRFSSALPLISVSRDSFIFSHVACNDTYFMGVALLNSNEESVSATIRVFSREGNLLRSRTVAIGARQRVSQLLTQWFPDLTGVNLSSGYIKVTAGKGLAAFALFGATNLSVLSAVPPQYAP